MEQEEELVEQQAAEQQEEMELSVQMVRGRRHQTLTEDDCYGSRHSDHDSEDRRRRRSRRGMRRSRSPSRRHHRDESGRGTS